MAERRADIVKSIEREKWDKRPENAYYTGVARKYKYAKYVTVLLLAVFLLYTFIAYGSYITYDNFMYLIKDFNTESAGAGANFAEVRYDDQENMSVALYNGELAVLGSRGLSLYSAGGSKTLGYSTNYSAPMLEVSDKYILAYDLGGKGYSLYTSIARVVNREADQVIMGAAVSDSGAYALVTRSSTSKFKVSLYSPTLNLKATYYKDSYVADAAVSEDGKSVVIASYELTGYDYTAEIMVCTSDKTEPVATVNVAGACPYKVEYLAEGGFYVICDTCILFFDGSGTMTERYSYGGRTLASAASNGTYTCLILSDSTVGARSEAVFLDGTGKEAFKLEINQRVKDVSVSSGHTVYVLTNTGVTRINPDLTVDSRECAGQAETIIAFDKYVLVCTPSGARAVSFADAYPN